MTEPIEAAVLRDSVSKNVLMESLSRVMTYIGGIVSSAVLYRAISESSSSLWKETDYAHLRVLMSWHQILLVVVLVGITTSVVKNVSQSAQDRQGIGTIIAVSLTVVTAMFLVAVFVTLGFAEPLGFLVGETPESTEQLRLLWFVVLLSLLPTAYMRIIKSGFAGLQRMSRTLIVDILYNGIRIVILLYLFFTLSVSIVNILYMYLFASVFACIVIFLVLLRETRREGIKLGFKGWKQKSGPLLKLASVFLILALISAFFNSATTLFVDYLGSDTDVARFSIAQSITLTFRSFLYAPFAVLLPNLAGIAAQGNIEDVRRRFDESNRVIIPTLIFACVSLFFFGESVLGAIYGLRGVDASGGTTAAQFLAALSITLLVYPITGIYSNVLTALGKLKILLLVGISSVLLQTAWIILLQPHYGVIVVAFSWVVTLPVSAIYHFYSKTKFGLYINRTTLIRGALATIILIPLACGMYLAASMISDLLGTIPLMTSTTIYSAFRLLFLIPLWYIFIAISLAVGFMGLEDVENLKKALKKVPPAWWVSRHMLEWLSRLARKNPLGPSQNGKQAPATQTGG